MSKSPLQPPRGTRDFYPEDLRRREWLFGHFRAVARRFGFEEIDAPIVEHEELFHAQGRRGDRGPALSLRAPRTASLALRPEMTPSVARMVLAKAGSNCKFPLRWFAITQNWRYERMTRGRKREHYQWNMDIWGEPGVAAEAELIAADLQLLRCRRPRRRDGRDAHQQPCAARGGPRSGPVLARPARGLRAALRRIDKLDKIGPEAVIGELLTDPDGRVRLDARPTPRNVVEMLWSQTSLDDAASAHVPAGLSRARRAATALRAARRVRRRRPSVSFDASVVRGLAYYTGIVFEAFDRRGEPARDLRRRPLRPPARNPGRPRHAGRGLRLRGRRDDGASVGQGAAPGCLRAESTTVVFAFGERERAVAAIRLAQRLRRAGRRVELVLGTPRSSACWPTPTAAGAARHLPARTRRGERGVAHGRDLASGRAERGRKARRLSGPVRPAGRPATGSI